MFTLVCLLASAHLSAPAARPAPTTLSLMDDDDELSNIRNVECCRSALLAKVSDGVCGQYEVPHHTLRVFEIFNTTETQQLALSIACLPWGVAPLSSLQYSDQP